MYKNKQTTTALRDKFANYFVHKDSYRQVLHVFIPLIHTCDMETTSNHRKIPGSLYAVTNDVLSIHIDY